MTKILLCTDGSPLAEHALHLGLQVVAADAELILATAAEEPDPTLVTGAGMAGGVMTGEEYDQAVFELQEGAEQHLASARARLGLGDEVAAVILRGDPGVAICTYAEEQGIDAIVIGSHGRSGLKRAMLGSVSDHVVRSAPCPVLVTAAHAAEGDDLAV